MADAPQNASPAPAVATIERSETPKNESTSPKDASTPPIKTEGVLQQRLDTVPTKPASESTPNPTLAPASDTTPAYIKQEVQDPPKETPAPASHAQPLSIAIPASTNGTGAPSTPGTAPTPPSGATAGVSSVLASILQGNVPTPAISPLSDVGPTKRSRTPEATEEGGPEKRQKTEHIAEDQPDQSTEAHGDDDDAEATNLLSWDLGAQLSNVLGSVEPEAANDTSGTAEDSVMDMMPSIPLPPPRKRLEKMKFIENPTYFSRAMGLPMLGSLSVQILLALFQQPSEVTDRQIRDVRTEGGKVYSALRQTFMAVLKLFTDATVFLSADDLDIHDPGDRETIQMANLASMCASFYGPGGPTMATAHDNFLKIMIPENGMITEDISALYLDQKTQSFLAYANVMEDKESTRNSLMDKFFPLDLEEKLRGYWRESNLAMSADDFVRPFTDRRNLLKAIGHDKEKRKALEAKYQFASFLDSLSAFTRSNFDSILDYAESHGFEVPNEAGEEDLMFMDAVQSQYSGAFPGQVRRSGPDGGFDSAGLASLITEKLTGYDGFAYGSSTIPESTILPPSQTLPTSILYERARQAAVAKSSAHARREGLHSTRRPWTPEEEKALMAGLDLVKGPHWSQILQLFGQNGTVSDILKDRTQVQLKDKARNLKLFFLKTNSEMPYYLQCVTGELKTRAPSQAARKEAEEQARVQTGSSPNTYASTYMNGTTNGTGGLPNHGVSMSGSPRPASATPGAGPSTPASANPSHHHPHQSQQTYQSHQGYSQQRPQQPAQQATSGTSHSTNTMPQQGQQPMAPRPLAPQSQHQPIAPAPSSYQRPLQQAGAPTHPQYQQRPIQQPAAQGPPAYQQAQRPMAPAPASSIPPRNIAASSTTPQTQSRPPAIAGQPSSTPPRPAAAAGTAPPRPASIPPPVGSAPSPAPAPAAKSMPAIMPAPPGQNAAVPATLPAKPIQQAPSQPSQAAVKSAQPVAPRPPIQSTALPAAVSLAPALTPKPTPAPASALAPISAPAPALSPVPPVPTPAPENPAQVAENKDRADDDLLANALKAAIDSA